MNQQTTNISTIDLAQKGITVNHDEMLSHLLAQIQPFNFRECVPFEIEAGELKRKHYLVLSIEQVLNVAKQHNWGLCKNDGFVYLFNGAYWSVVDTSQLQAFLGRAAEKMGVGIYEARFYSFQESLVKQFFTAAILPKPNKQSNEVCINLKNGTFVITPEKQVLNPHNSADFLTYQLPFEYNPDAQAPLFNAYLNKVLPDIDRQKVLAEYLGYIFIPTSHLKMEKALLLYGSGANGKSVFFEIVYALLGSQNVVNYSLQSLTNENAYFRANLANKLLNYASEINGKLESSFFKLLVSGEPIEARLPYQPPFLLTNYAKLMFNCNELPKDVEQTNAYFRRFLIIPFDVTVAEHEQDKDLSAKIIKSELSGVFNWVLSGLQRLLQQKHFTKCQAAETAVEDYKRNSNTVALFLEEDGYVKSKDCNMSFALLYTDYRSFCYIGGYNPVNKGNFKKRLMDMGLAIDRKSIGYVVSLDKHSR